MDDKKPIMKSHESIHIVGFIDTHQIPYPPDVGWIMLDPIKFLPYHSPLISPWHTLGDLGWGQVLARVCWKEFEKGKVKADVLLFRDEWYERLGSEGSPVSPSFAADEVSCSFIFLLLDPVKPPFFRGKLVGTLMNCPLVNPKFQGNPLGNHPNQPRSSGSSNKKTQDPKSHRSLQRKGPGQRKAVEALEVMYGGWSECVILKV
jgi:hypothetical protein